MFRNIIAAILLVFSFLILYYLNFYKKFNYYYYSSSILENSKEKLKNIEESINNIGSNETIKSLMKAKDTTLNKFMSSLLVYHKDIIANDYPTLKSLFEEFSKSHINEDWNSLKRIISSKKSIIRDSSLDPDVKIRLFNEIRNFSLALEDYINAKIKFDKFIEDSTSQLNTAIDVFSKDTLNLNALKKIKEFEQSRYLFNLIAYISLFFGLMLFLVEYFTIKKRINYEIKVLTETCDSIRNGSQAEVLIKLKRVRLFNKVKNSIFETIKFLTNKIDYFQDMLCDIKIPLKYTSDSGELTENNEYKKLYPQIKDKNFDLINNLFYEHHSDSYSEYYTFINKNNTIPIIEKELLGLINKNEISTLSNETKSFINITKEDKLFKDKYFLKNRLLISRFYKGISFYRQLKNDLKKVRNSLEHKINDDNNLFSKTLKLSENINYFGSAVNDLRLDYQGELKIIEGLDVLKGFFNENIKKLDLIFSEIDTYQKSLDVLSKDLELKGIEKFDVLVLKNTGASICKDIQKIRHTFFRFESLLKNVSLTDEDKINKLENLYKELFYEIDEINISLESNTRSLSF